MNNAIKRLIIFLHIILFVVCGGIGIYYRGTYTDITAQPDFMDEIMVCEMDGELVRDFTDFFLSEAKLILCVEAYGQTEYEFRTIRQKVKVQEVFRGEKNLAGQDIYLQKGSWLLWEDGTRNMGFVNEMQEGERYLVFLEAKIDNIRRERIDTYALPDTIIAPVFCYSDKENVIIPQEETKEGYVKYKLVKENEFFADSEEALGVMLNMKKKLIGQFPISANISAEAEYNFTKMSQVSPEQAMSSNPYDLPDTFSAIIASDAEYDKKIADIEKYGVFGKAFLTTISSENKKGVEQVVDYLNSKK